MNIVVSVPTLLKYKYMVLFAWVLIEQVGIPLPSAPVLIAAGALSAERRINVPLTLATGVAGAMIADGIWFFAGRKYGTRVMHLVYKMSMHPADCVRCAQAFFNHWGRLFLIFAKFVPGVSLVAPPMAGQFGMRFRMFLLLDGVGSMLWVGALIAAGRYFGDLIKHNARVLNWATHFSFALIISSIVTFLLARVHRRHVVLKTLAASRVEPQELKRKLDAGEPVFIVDLRHPLELLVDPFTLPGALHISPEELTAHQKEIPRDREVVLYCTCPSEATAAKTAMTLHSFGIEHMQSLRGGFDEWKRLGYPLDRIPPVMPLRAAMQSLQ